MDNDIQTVSQVSGMRQTAFSGAGDQQENHTTRKRRWPWLRVVLCIGSFWWGSIGSTTVRGEGTKGEEYLRKALQAFETRGDQLNPVWLRYEVTEFESKRWQEEVTRGRQNAKGQKPILSDLRWKVKVEYARKGDKVRASMSDDLPASTGGGRTRLEAYNGEIRVTTISGDDRYEISRKPGSIGAYGSPWELAGEERIQSVLRNWTTGKQKITVTSVSEEHLSEGVDALVIVVVYPVTGWWSKIWFLPASEFAIHKLEVYNKQNQLLEQALTTEWETVAGIQIPKRGSSTHYYYGKIGKQRTFEVESVVLKRGDIPDRLFEVKIPKDAVIFDTDLNVLIRDPEQAQSHLEQVLSKVQRDKHPWRMWLILGASTGCLALLASLLIVRRRWKNLKPVGPPRA